MIVEARKGCLRRNIPSAKRNEDQNVPPDIQGDVPGVLLIKTCSMNVQEGWELGNI